MRIVFHFRYLALLFGVSILQPSPSSGALTWETQRVEISAKSVEKQVTGVFRFKNSGDVAVTITAAKPSCGCTTAELAKPTYAPGEAGEIRAVFTIGDREGPQEKIIEVTTDDAPTKPVPLVLRVNIPEVFTCTPRVLLWRVGDELSEKPVVVAPVDPIKVSALEVKLVIPNDASFRVEPFDDGSKYRLFIRPKSSAKIGQVALSCVVKLSDGSFRPFTVYALVR